MRSGSGGIAMAVALVAALAAATPARAEDPVRLEVTGEAAAGAQDARTRALDAAFAGAVSQALERLVDAQVQRRRGEDIARVTVRRARRFVRSYRVLEEGTRDERMQVRIAAQIDMDGLRAALAELGIEASAGDTAAPGPASGASNGAKIPAAPPGAPGALLLIRTHTAGSRPGSDDLEGGAAGQALARQVRELGFAVRGTGANRARPRSDDPRALPFDDDAAAEFGQQAGAACVVVAGLEIAPPVRIRGTRLHGAAGSARIRVLDVRSGAAEVVAEAEVSGGGFSGAPDAALEQAQSALGRQLAGAVADLMAGHFRPAVAAEGALLVEIRGHTGWQDIDAIMTHLARTSGIERVWPRRVGSALILAVDADVDGDRAQRRVASILEKLSLPAAALEVERTRQGLLITIEPRAAGSTP
ncbi:MAG TPA: hypothetical protein VNM90_24680 [Haliangium sp.]|nr:hypothetical protein [Haliangium sp.]